MTSAIEQIIQKAGEDMKASLQKRHKWMRSTVKDQAVVKAQQWVDNPAWRKSDTSRPAVLGDIWAWRGVFTNTQILAIRMTDLKTAVHFYRIDGTSAHNALHGARVRLRAEILFQGFEVLAKSQSITTNQGASL